MYRDNAQAAYPETPCRPERCRAVRSWHGYAWLGVAATLAWAVPEARAQDTSTDEEPAQTHRLGVEIDLVQPFIPTVHIVKPKLSWTVWGESGGLRGDLLVFLYIRPHVRHDVLQTIDEYMLGVGYRQYLWRGLHLELLLEGGVAWGTNLFDGQRYVTPTLFGEANVGYRFGFFEPGGLAGRDDARVGFYITPQFGTLVSLGVADIGPRNGKPDWFLQGNLLVGLSF